MSCRRSDATKAEVPAPESSPLVMRHRRSSLLERLRRSPPIRWAAIVALLFQVVLSTDHLGAAAARAFGPSPIDEALGILSMCHGDGSIDVVDQRDPTERPLAAPCILCTVAAIAANGVVALPPMVVPPLDRVTAEVAIPSGVGVVVRSPLRYGTERGPPPSILV